MATTSSRCREVAESSWYLAKKETRCAPSSAPSKLHQLKTLTAQVRSTLLRPTPRRSSYSALGLRGAAPPAAPLEDPLQRLGHLRPLHRKARVAPSSGWARGLSSRGPRTWPTSRGRRSGTTWRHASRHVSLRRTPICSRVVDGCIVDFNAQVRTPVFHVIGCEIGAIISDDAVRDTIMVYHAGYKVDH